MATKHVRSSHTVFMVSPFHCICEKRSNTIYEKYSEPKKIPKMYRKLISFLIYF